MGDAVQQVFQRAGVAIVGIVLAGCGQGTFLTPRATISNAGLNTLMSENSPSLSGDGRLLVFTSNREGSENIYLYDLETRRFIDLPRLNRDDWAMASPTISANGRFIVFLSNALGRSDVFLYDRETQQIENISNRLPGDVRNPTVSADGRFIAFESNGAGQWDIEIFDRGVAAIPPAPSEPAAPSS